VSDLYVRSRVASSGQARWPLLTLGHCLGSQSISENRFDRRMMSCDLQGSPGPATSRATTMATMDWLLVIPFQIPDTMEFLLQVNLSCFLLSYVVALVAEVVQFARARSHALQATVFVASLAGLVAHTAYLIARFQSSGLPPLVGSSHDWLLVVAWLGVALLLLLTFRTKSSQAIFLLPIVVILILLAISVDATPSSSQRTDSERWWTMLHASSLAIGIGLVAAATGSALMYLLQYRKLHGRIAWVTRLQLPSLERLTSVNFWLVMLCYPPLTIGLFTGFVLVGKMLGNNDELWREPIVWGTIILWLMMTVNMAWLLRKKDQTGRMVARRTLLAGALLLVTIFGLTFVTGGIHNKSGPSKSSDNTELTPPRTSPE